MSVLQALLGRFAPGVATGSVSALIDAGTHGFAPPLPADPARDDAVRAVVPLVPELGWTFRALREAAGPDADLMFPGGPAEMVEVHSALADAVLEREAVLLTETRISRRVRALLLMRLEQAAPDRHAVRQGLSLLSLPPNMPVAARSLARTVDAIWNAAGDGAAGFGWYSKRAILAGIYTATLLRWLRNGDMESTTAFLDRQLAAVARLNRRRGSGSPASASRG